MKLHTLQALLVVGCCVAAVAGESPVSMTAGDFDGDGVPDLVCVFTRPEGDFLTLHRGNVDAIFPNTPAARQRRAGGELVTAPLRGPEPLGPITVSPDLLTACAGITELPMRLNADAVPDYVECRDDGSLFLMLSAPQAVITVNSSADSATPGDGACTLREAILNSNADGDSTAGDCTAGAGTDEIGFDIGGGGVPVTIALSSGLPPISDPVTINGNTQSCASPPCIDLNGIPTLSAQGLELNAGSTTVRGLTIRGFDENGILVQSTGNFIEGNHIGTDISGNVPFPNSMAGVFLSSSGNTVGGTTPAARNLLSANTDGVNMNQSATGNTVAGNYIGTNAAGTGSLQNAVWGVFVGGSNNVIGGETAGAGNLVSGNAFGGIGLNGVAAFDNQVSGNRVGVDASGAFSIPNQSAGIILSNSASANVVGGTSPSARNVVSGNADFGIVFGTGATGNVAEGNYVGTDPTGSFELGNDLSGILLQDAPGNTIGGTADGAGNLVSGNGEWGILVFETNGPSGNNEILGNRIGTNAGGTAAIPNTLEGVRIGVSPNNTIGGGNLISGNASNGVRIDGGASGVLVTGNFIGTDASGSTVLPNTGNGVLVQSSPGNTLAGNTISGNLQNGVFLQLAQTSGTQILGNQILGNNRAGILAQSASGNSIGGTQTGDGNVIAASGAEGVAIRGASVSNRILGNSILDNGSLGIDLGAPDGVTPNDSGDGDTGANDLQNHPELTAAAGTVSSVTVDGTFSSATMATYRVEFFAGEECDASGHGEGQRFLGFANVSTDGTGSGSFSETLMGTASEGDSITATATDSFDNTSEFSACVVATCRDLVAFGQTVLAQDVDTLLWTNSLDVRFVKGDLADVATYVTNVEGLLLGATMLDISNDDPAPGFGLYFLLRPSGCGSWQTQPAAEPARDASLP